MKLQVLLSEANDTTMSNSAIWKNALFSDKYPPVLTFVTSMRHPVSPRTTCLVHSHPAVEIVHHPVGQGLTRLHHKTLAYAAKSVVIYAPFEKHDQVMTMEGEDLVVQVAVPKRMVMKLRSCLYLARLEIPWIVEEIQSLCRQVVPADHAERKILNLRATTVLLGLVQAIHSGSENLAGDVGMHHVRQAERYIQEHYATIDSLQAVAEHAEVSHDHLRHLFKSIRGKSLIGHLTEVRVARAKLLLTHSPLPLKQIASLCGFKDEYYFSAVFRKAVAVSPGAYRQQFTLH